MSNKGDQLWGELLLSSRHLLSGNVKVNCQEYRVYTPTAAIQCPQGCWEGGKLRHLGEIIIDSLVEGTGHSRSCGHCAVFCLQWAQYNIEVLETMGTESIALCVQRPTDATLF